MKLIPSEWPGSPVEQTSSALEILPISAVNSLGAAGVAGWWLNRAP